MTGPANQETHGLPPREAETPAPPADAFPMPRYDLVAVDLDGTLLRSDKRLDPRDVYALRLAVSRGVRVVLATARPPRTAREVHQLLGLDTPLIAYNGAMVVAPDPAGFAAAGQHPRRYFREVYHRPMPGDLAREVFHHARRLDPRVLVSLEVEDRWHTDREDPQFSTETAKAFRPDVVGPLDEVFARPVTKLMLLHEPDRLAPIKAQVLQNFRSKLAFFVSDRHLLQLCHPGVDKATALAWVVGRCDIDPDRVLAIGDAPNDAAMLRWAGLGVAVANAWDEAKAAADRLTTANDDAGVARAVLAECLQSPLPNQ